MAINYPDVPHFCLPFKIAIQGHGTPKALVCEQDSEEEIFDCVETVLRYEQGYRIESPEFGIPDQTFAEPAPDVNKIYEAINIWEPRAEPIISVRVDEMDSLLSRIKVAI